MGSCSNSLQANRSDQQGRPGPQIDYVRKELNCPQAEWAAIGATIHLLLGLLSRNVDAKGPLDSLFQCEQLLEFGDLQGIERGRLARRFREEFSRDFQRYSDCPAKVLKGKSPARILWAVATPDNVDEVASWIGDFVGKKQ
jgi:hypothetical protein